VSLAPARNFTLTLAERVRALAGPPAYSVRKRAMEDLEDRILKRLRELPLDVATRTSRRDMARLIDLVERHNRYYPVEANLPMEPLTGVLLDCGEPWKPLPFPTIEALYDRARSAGSLGYPGIGPR